MDHADQTMATRDPAGGCFGICPECDGHDGYFNIGANHWFACHTHKTKWKIGENLFSSWKDKTEEQWRTNAETLSSYEEVEPDMPQVANEPSPTNDDFTHKIPF